MSDGAQNSTTWEPQHYGPEDGRAYSGLDLARGPDRTAWRCSCGKSGSDVSEIDCNDWGCPTREFLT